MGKFDSKAVLAANVAALIRRERERRADEGLSRRQIAASLKIDVKALERAEKGEGLNLANVDTLAEAFKMEPWQLLHPNPESVPNLPDEIQGIADAIARIPGDLQRAQALARAYRAAFRSDRHEDVPEEVQTTQEPREVHRG